MQAAMWCPLSTHSLRTALEFWASVETEIEGQISSFGAGVEKVFGHKLSGVKGKPVV